MDIEKPKDEFTQRLLGEWVAPEVVRKNSKLYKPPPVEIPEQYMYRCDYSYDMDEGVKLWLHKYKVTKITPKGCKILLSNGKEKRQRFETKSQWCSKTKDDAVRCFAARKRVQANHLTHTLTCVTEAMGIALNPELDVNTIYCC